MRGRRRFWLSGAAALVTAGYGVLFNSPILVVGAFVALTWAIANQLGFVFELRQWQTETTLSRTIQPTVAQTDEELTVSTEITADIPARTRATLRTPIPQVLEHQDGSTETELGSLSQATTTVSITSPVAGSFEIPPAELHVRDTTDLFSETIPIGDPVSFRVDPPQPRNIHIGMGGERLAAAYGEHEAESGSGGMVPDQLRAYMPGDPVKLIDWNATARLDDVYVREVQAQTDRRTVVILDRRGSMADGPPGRRKIDIAREVALTYVEAAKRISDPLGYREIGSEGETAVIPTGTDTNRYKTIDDRIRAAEPTTEPSEPPLAPIGPGRATTRASQLTGDDPFSHRLRPFFESGDAYVTRVRSDPLFKTVQEVLQRSDGQTLAILFTDDSHPTELRQAAKLLSASGNQALLFVLPGAVFGPDSLEALDTAYHDYVTFETFRRRLSRLNGISAFEVAPRDRLTEILDHIQSTELEASA